MEQVKTKAIFQRLPVQCPWIARQPYPSSPGKNRSKEMPEINSNFSINNHLPVQMEMRTHDKNCPSMQQSSSQFFYFLRLMQLFPDTHPATLHTVLTLCKNDFFCAVDKLLYAKRCKVMYNRRQNIYQSFCKTRSHPYQGVSSSSNKSSNGQQEKGKNVENLQKIVSEKPVEIVKKQSVIVKANETLPESSIEDNIAITINELTNTLSPSASLEEVKDLSETGINICL